MGGKRAGEFINASDGGINGLEIAFCFQPGDRARVCVRVCACQRERGYSSSIQSSNQSAPTFSGSRVQHETE